MSQAAHPTVWLRRLLTTAFHSVSKLILCFIPYGQMVVPRLKAEVAEYRQHTLRCVACGAANRAELPADMPRGSIGARAQAIISYLTGRLALSHRDAADAMRVLHGLEVSVGSIASVQRQVSEALRAWRCFKGNWKETVGASHTTIRAVALSARSHADASKVASIGEAD